MPVRRFPAMAAMILLVALTIYTVVITEADLPIRLVALTSHPQRVMGTSCRLTAVVEPGREERARLALKQAEAALRRVEGEMSAHLEASLLSRFNRAGAGATIELPPHLHQVLIRALAIQAASDGAFDITCRPLLELWKTCGRRGRLPDRTAIDKARAGSRRQDLTLRGRTLTKTVATLRLDLGGIAKGYGIDLALEEIRKNGCKGGMVDVGGDLKVYGQTSQGGKWAVQIRNPAGGSVPLTTVYLEAGAVCTSGHYFRHVTIAGRRYSHIVDPRTGMPAAIASSVTTITARATDADAWATALSVLGPAGLPTVEKTANLEALIVTGKTDHPTLTPSTGFPTHQHP